MPHMAQQRAMHHATLACGKPMVPTCCSRLLSTTVESRVAAWLVSNAPLKKLMCSSAVARPGSPMYKITAS